MAGRKSKLTPELMEETTKLIRAGNYNETVCQYLGIHKSTFYKWMAEGEQAKSGIKREFFDSVKKAEAHAEIRNVQVIQKAASDDSKHWTAAMTFLERKFPDRWGKKDKVSADIEHSGQVTQRNEYDIHARIEKYEDVYSKIAERGKVQSDNEGYGS